VTGSVPRPVLRPIFRFNSMPSIERDLAALTKEVTTVTANHANLRERMDSAERERKADHDMLLGHKEQLKTVFQRVGALEQGGSTAVAEERSKNWQIWAIVLSAFAGGAVTLIAGLILRRMGL